MTMKTAIILALLLANTGCKVVHVAPVAPPPPPMPPVPSGIKTNLPAVVKLPGAVVVPSNGRMLYWDCGCGVAMPHPGHEFDVVYSADLKTFKTVRTNRAPVVVYQQNVYFKVGCHLGNW